MMLLARMRTARAYRLMCHLSADHHIVFPLPNVLGTCNIIYFHVTMKSTSNLSIYSELLTHKSRLTCEAPSGQVCFPTPSRAFPSHCLIFFISYDSEAASGQPCIPLACDPLFTTLTVTPMSPLSFEMFTLNHGKPKPRKATKP